MSFLDKILGKETRRTSSDIAKERLQLVLVQDRVNISPRMLDMMKDEIIEVISKYVEIDRDGMEIQLTQTGHQSRLEAYIPVIGRRAVRGERK